MEYCDLGSLDSAIADGRFQDMVSLPHRETFMNLMPDSQSLCLILSRILLWRLKVRKLCSPKYATPMGA